MRNANKYDDPKNALLLNENREKFLRILYGYVQNKPQRRFSNSIVLYSRTINKQAKIKNEKKTKKQGNFVHLRGKKIASYSR